MEATDTVPAVFDGAALMRAVDERRIGLGMPWPGVAAAITAQSADLRARTDDHDLCAGALVRTVRRQTMSCQYALMLLRWLDRVPEQFVAGGGDPGWRLPAASSGERLRWDLQALSVDLRAARVQVGLSWAGLAARLGCTPNRLVNLQKARDADMALVMSVLQWLDQSSSRYIRAVAW